MDKDFIYGRLLATSLCILLDFNNIFLFICIPYVVKHFLLLFSYLITERVFEITIKEKLYSSHYYHSGKNLQNSCQMREKVSFSAMKFREKVRKNSGKNLYIILSEPCHGFIASSRAFNLLTRGFNRSTRAFNPAIRVFSFLIGQFELVTHRSELVTCISELVTHKL